MKKTLIRLLSLLLVALLAVLTRYFYPKGESSFVPTQVDGKEELGIMAEEEFTGEIPVFTGDISQYLQPDNPRVVKYAKTGDYEVFTLDLTCTNDKTCSQVKKVENIENNVSCHLGYQSTDCVNAITKSGEVIFISIPTADKYYHPIGIGSFYAFTTSGAIFFNAMGDGFDCRGEEYLHFSYYNFPTGKMLYGIYTTLISGKEIVPTCERDECDPYCEVDNTERTITTGFTFSDIPSWELGNQRGIENPLDIQADNIEEAFYQYYQVNL